MGSYQGIALAIRSFLVSLSTDLEIWHRVTTGYCFDNVVVLHSVGTISYYVELDDFVDENIILSKLVEHHLPNNCRHSSCLNEKWAFDMVSNISCPNINLFRELRAFFSHPVRMFGRSVTTILTISMTVNRKRAIIRKQNLLLTV